MYKKGIVGEVNSLEKQVKAIDNLISSARLVVDMMQGIAAMDSYLWIYYTRTDQMMQGFCVMFRNWVNFQRSWKKGDLLRLIENGDYHGITTQELESMAKQKQYPPVMSGRVSPTPLQTEKLTKLTSDEQKKQFLTEYVNNRYCLWPEAAPVQVLCIGTQGEVIASVEQKSDSLTYKTHE